VRHWCPEDSNAHSHASHNPGDVRDLGGRGFGRGPFRISRHERRLGQVSEQCNQCGGYAGVNPVQPCEMCSTLICGRCKLSHEMVCTVAQAMKQRGQGPTIRKKP